jgi:hypothetical protein
MLIYRDKNTSKLAFVPFKSAFYQPQKKKQEKQYTIFSIFLQISIEKTFKKIMVLSI